MLEDSGVLVELQRWASESARAVTLLNPSELVRGMLAVTNLESVLHASSLKTPQNPRVPHAP
jgi:hypothetical protein